MYDPLMNAASALYLACYIPELYANYKNKNANIYNLPEKVVMLVASGLAFAYSLANDDETLLANYGPILALDTIAFLMRGYYAYINYRPPPRPYQAQEDTPEPGNPHV